MALKKVTELPDGNTAEYWRIEEINISPSVVVNNPEFDNNPEAPPKIIVSKAVVTLGLYKDRTSADRLNGKKKCLLKTINIENVAFSSAEQERVSPMISAYILSKQDPELRDSEDILE